MSPPSQSPGHRSSCARGRRSARRRTGLLLTLTLATCGCRAGSRVFQPTRAESLREAGSVHLAVLAVAPWSEYVQALKPDFGLQADAALAKVAKDARWRSQASLSASGASAESVLLDESQGGGRKPAKAASALHPAEGSGDGRDGGAFLFADGRRERERSSGEAAEPEVGPDSMLQYSAATALYQEVQLLERYIGDAAIPAGFRPYMVRLQVSLMPSRRHAPYDVYTTLSFFVPGEQGAAAATAPRRTTDDGIFERPFGDGPKVLPLIVTDNLEASLESHSLESLRTLLVSLLDFPGNSFIEPLFGAMMHGALRDQVFGRDLNSLLTVARLSENTLRIRLGATQEATANYAMVPRNHNVTLLLMVPEDAPPLMEVVSKTVLVDTESGRELAADDGREELEVLRRFRKERRLDALELDTLRSMHALARQNDQAGFTALLRAGLPAEQLAGLDQRSLWIELVSLVVGDQFASSLFELPGQGQDAEVSSAVFQGQTVVVEDDGARAWVTLREARFPDFEQVLAVLGVPGSEPPILLPAEDVEMDLTRRELHATFPSLRRWRLLEGLADESGSGAPPLALKLSWAGRELGFHARYVEVEPAPSSDSGY